MYLFKQNNNKEFCSNVQPDCYDGFFCAMEKTLEGDDYTPVMVEMPDGSIESFKNFKSFEKIGENLWRV